MGGYGQLINKYNYKNVGKRWSDNIIAHLEVVCWFNMFVLCSRDRYHNICLSFCKLGLYHLI